MDGKITLLCEEIAKFCEISYRCLILSITSFAGGAYSAWAQFLTSSTPLTGGRRLPGAGEAGWTFCTSTQFCQLSPFHTAH